MTIIAVFGSSQVQPGSDDYTASEAVGAALARAGFAVMTGGYAGVMGAASKGANEAGGHVIGVTTAQIEAIRPGARANAWVHEVIPYPNLQQRMDHLIREADGYVVMPGGVGTLAELVLAWEFMRVGEFPMRPLICYGELWQRTLAAFLDSRYVPTAHQQMIDYADGPDDVIAFLKAKGL